MNKRKPETEITIKFKSTPLRSEIIRDTVRTVMTAIEISGRAELMEFKVNGLEYDKD